MKMPAPTRSPVALAAIIAALYGAAAAPATGQRSDSERGALAGAVVESLTGAPIAGATVVLQPEVAGAFPGPAAGSAFASATRAATSDSAGAYRFDRLPPGVYRVYVSRYGYRPYSLVVELHAARETAVSIGLATEPIAVGALRATGRPPRGSYARADAFGDDVHLARLMATDLRRRRFLTTDVRELTHADVVEAVTLGEPDVLRALQRLPGVTTRSDYTAELWTRGAPWSQTRVYYDGVPLFNPLHALGLISGIGSSSIGAAWFHPGVRSAAIGEGAAGVVDLQSRRGTGAGELNLQADVSLATAGLALDQRVLDGRAGWMIAGRHTYLDWLADLARRAADDGDASFPYGFGEIAGRADLRIGESTSIEVSGLWERDRLSSEHEDSLGVMRAEWGNALGRVTLATRLGRLHARHTAATSRHHGSVGSHAPGPDFAVAPAVEWELGRTRVDYRGVSGSLAPEPTSIAGPAWTLGYGLELHRVGYYGPTPLPVPRTAAQTLNAEDAGGDTSTVSWTADLPIGVLWGERSWAVGDRLSVRAGLRLEGGSETAGDGALRVAPRLSARWSPHSEIALSAGAGRVFQYTQALAPGGVQLASLVSSDVWLLAGENVPAIRADMVTAGLEAWIGTSSIATLNGFGRHASGLALPDPRPGPVFGRDSFVTGANTAYGLEAGLRRIAGTLTGSVSYTLLRSRTKAAGVEYPSAADRTHVLDVTAMVRALPSLRLGAAFTAATGVPFTRTVGAEEACSTTPGCDPAQLPWSGPAHAERAPAFASLDLLADWTTDYAGLEIGLYAQLRNALGRANATVYTGDVAACLPVGCGGDDLRNAYERGVPRLPVIGLRVRR